MGRRVREFFWLPESLLSWLRLQMNKPDIHLWSERFGDFQWQVKADALDGAVLRGDIEELFDVHIGREGISTFTLKQISRRFSIDFGASYVVRLVPSVVTMDGGALLMGRLEMLPPERYDDEKRAKQLDAFYHELRAELGALRDADRVIVQPLAQGGEKYWRDIWVGPGVAESGYKLKQFAQGPVEFFARKKSA